MEFQHMASLPVEAAAWFTGVSDLAFRQDAGELRLYALAQPRAGGALSGGLASVALGNDGLVVTGIEKPPTGPVAGVTPQLTLLDTDKGAVALLSGTAGNGLWSVGLESNGALGSAPPGWRSTWPHEITATALIEAQGGSLLFGAPSRGSAPMVWRLGATGIDPLFLPSLPALPANGIAPVAIADMTGFRSGTTALMLTVETGSNALVSWRLDARGEPQQADRVDAEDGLWIAGPSAVAGLSLNGQGYAIAAAQGSGTISVAAIAVDGTMHLTDHLIDDRSTRFGAAHLLATAETDGGSYVLAGGNDQGLSLFRLLPEGRLLHLLAVEDRADLNLTRLTALSMTARSGHLEIVTASGSEPGLVWQRISPPPGLELSGTARPETLQGGNGADLIWGAGGDDLLSGGAGDDIVMDGPGRDMMRGGAGADVFVLAADGHDDTILDFDPTSDQIDLSGWRFLRSTRQLSLSETPRGAEIRYENEVLRLVSTDGRPIPLDRLASLELLPATRLLSEWTTPLTPLATDFRIEGTPNQDTLSGGAGEDEIYGMGEDDLLQGGGGADALFGGAGSDVIEGGGGDDRITGGIGWDVVRGGEGDDRITALDGYDSLYGGKGDDIITGNNGFDRLWGHNGADLLSGGMSPDELYGGTGDDRLSGEAGADLIEGGAGADTISGNAGPDRLFGGSGNDTVLGGINHDRIEGGSGHDLLRGEAGNDRLDGQGGNDLLYGGGGGGRDVFVFTAGHDRIA